MISAGDQDLSNEEPSGEKELLICAGTSCFSSRKDNYMYIKENVQKFVHHFGRERYHMFDILNGTLSIDYSKKCIESLLLLECPGHQKLLGDDGNNSGHRGVRKSRCVLMCSVGGGQELRLGEQNPFKRPFFSIQATQALYVRRVALSMLIFQVH
jgi:hypothetical protein